MRALLVFLVACTPAVATPPPAAPAPAPAPAPPPGPVAAPATEPVLDLVAQGKALVEKKGCVACHTLDGTPRIGPTLKGYFGATLTQADGATVTGSVERFRTSVLTPSALPLAGYPNAMPAFEGHITDAELGAMIAYVQSL